MKVCSSQHESPNFPPLHLYILSLAWTVRLFFLLIFLLPELEVILLSALLLLQLEICFFWFPKVVYLHPLYEAYIILWYAQGLPFLNSRFSFTFCKKLVDHLTYKKSNKTKKSKITFLANVRVMVMKNLEKLIADRMRTVSEEGVLPPRTGNQIWRLNKTASL